MILVKDISFGQAEMSTSAVDPQPSMDIKHFDWEGKGKGKRACWQVEDDGRDAHALTLGTAACCLRVFNLLFCTDVRSLCVLLCRKPLLCILSSDSVFNAIVAVCRSTTTSCARRA